MRGFQLGLVLAGGAALFACVEDTSGLGPALGGPPSRPAPEPECVDRFACTEDILGPDGACQHVPRHDLCLQDPCTRATCVPTRGCLTELVADGTICADGPACAPYTCLSGLCAQRPAPDGAACDDLDPCTQGDRCAAGVCEGATGAPGGVLARRFLIDQPRAATFVRDRLLVEVPAGGPRLRWVQRDGDRAAPVSDAGFSMDGTGRIFPLHEGAWVRVGYGGRGETLYYEQIEDDGAVLSSRGGVQVGTRPLDAPDTVTRAGALYFCALDDANRVRLHGFDIPTGPAGSLRPMVQDLLRDPCRHPEGGGLSARGKYWVRWENAPTGPLITAYEMTEEGADVLLSFSYAPDGAHRYGLIEAVAVDEDGLLVIALENPQWVYVIDLVTGAIETSSLDRPADTQLLAVRDRKAIFAVGAELAIYDVQDVNQPSERRVAGRLAPGSARVLDADGQRMAIVDAQDRLHWFEPSATGLPYARDVLVRGQGSLADLVPLGGRLVGWSERHVIAFEASWLASGAIDAAPVAYARAPDSPVAAVRSDDGAVLIGRPRHPVADACRAAGGGWCPQDMPIDGPQLPIYDVTPTGIAFNQVLLQGLGSSPAVAVRDGLAFHFVPRALPEPWFATTGYDGQLQAGPVQAGPLTDREVFDARIDVHPGAVTVRGGGRAFLYPRSAAGIEPMLAEVSAPGAVGAAWLPPYWYVFSEGTGGAIVRTAETYEVRPGAEPVLVGRQDLSASVDRFVGQDQALVYTYTGGRVGFWRPTDEGLVSSFGTDVVSPPLHVVSGGALGTLLVRPDGVTVLSPSCL